MKTTQKSTFARVTTQLLVMLLACLGIVGALSSPAQAVAPQISSGASLRYCITTTLSGCQSTSLTWAGGSVSMICYQDGSTATGAYTSNRWFYLTQGTLRGWAHSSRVTNQVSVPNCSEHRGVSTATWAARRHGETSATRAQADWMWGVGTDARWSGGCAGFVSAAYYFGAGVTNLRHRGNTRPMYLDYLADGTRMRSMSTTPSIGAAVFWPNESPPYGHTAIYVGNGYVMTTTGSFGDTLPNSRMKMSSVSTMAPSGWVHPNDM